MVLSYIDDLIKMVKLRIYLYKTDPIIHMLINNYALEHSESLDEYDETKSSLLGFNFLHYLLNLNGDSF